MAESIVNITEIKQNIYDDFMLKIWNIFGI